MNDGGCDSAEDPNIDARQASPLWNTGTDQLLHVQATVEPAQSRGEGFKLWRVSGRKRVVHRGRASVLTATVGPQWLRIAVDTALSDGVAYRCTVPLTPRLRGELVRYRMEARWLAGELGLPRSRSISRAALLHLRALQTLDAAQAGASHRDIAAVIFGTDAVRGRWSADGELRAQVRHLLGRARSLMNGGYLDLAGVHRSRPATSGDEPPG